MKLHTNTIRILLLFIGIIVWPQSSAQDSIISNYGQDFWVAFLINGGSQSNEQQRLMAAAPESGFSVTATNPFINWTYSQTAPANCLSIGLPTSSGSFPTTSGVVGHNAIHITSTTDISLTAINTQEYSTGVGIILPTNALRSRYRVLDYPTDPRSVFNSGASVMLVGTENGTNISMTLPCAIEGIAQAAGSVFNLVLNAGESFLMVARADSASLSGMEVIADKPFALFQGNMVSGVPHTATSGDYMFEQSIPTDYWGTDFALVPTAGRSTGDRVRMVADEACTVTVSNSSTYSLAAGEIVEFDLPQSAALRLQSTAPISVGLCMESSEWNGEQGDASLAMITPLNHGQKHADFVTQYTAGIGIFYVTLVTRTEYVDIITLDDNPIASSFAAIDADYSWARVQITGSATGTYHSIDAAGGSFVGWSYGVGNVDGYIHSLGMVFRPHHDTIILEDTICQGEAYYQPLADINVTSNQTAEPCMIQLWSEQNESDTLVHHYCLNLTVLPSYNYDTTIAIIAGDSILFCDSLLTMAGTYTFHYSAGNGCDSTITLHLNYQPVSLTASAESPCLGEDVQITASGTNTYIWTSDPADPALDSLQGKNPISVHPTVTTVYYLVDFLGNHIASITIAEEEPPMLCVECNREYLDFDYPVLSFSDCSADSYLTTWTFYDGQTFEGKRIARTFSHPLPDSVTVTMTVCNQYNCCADTTVSIPMEIHSVWFPNVFTPDADQNNLFGCFTSMQVVSFKLYIFNRWGFEIWSTEDVNDAWDGTCNGTSMPQGAYVYRWYLTDRHGDKRDGIGTVTLLR